MKWYSWETMFMSLAEDMREYLLDHDIPFEISDGRTPYDTAMVWHFEVNATVNELAKINAWLDKRTICERTA